MITVMGATGQTGGATARRLLDAGEHVRALGRSADRLAALRTPGPSRSGRRQRPLGAHRGVPRCRRRLRAAAVAPEVPDLHAHHGPLGRGDRHRRAVAPACRTSWRSAPSAPTCPAARGSSTRACTPRRSVRRPHRRPTCCPPAGLVLRERHGWLPVIAEQGVMADSVAPDAPLPMVATRDVGAAAAAALRSRDWTGFAVRELLGPRDLTHAEVARMIGAAVGRPDLAYVQIPEDDLRAALAGCRLVARRRPPAGRDEPGVQRRAASRPQPPHGRPRRRRHVRGLRRRRPGARVRRARLPKQFSDR